MPTGIRIPYLSPRLSPREIEKGASAPFSTLFCCWPGVSGAAVSAPTKRGEGFCHGFRRISRKPEKVTRVPAPLPCPWTLPPKNPFGLRSVKKQELPTAIALDNPHIWSRQRESNPQPQLGKLMYYHYTMPARQLGLLYHSPKRLSMDFFEIPGGKPQGFPTWRDSLRLLSEKSAKSKHMKPTADIG